MRAHRPPTGEWDTVTRKPYVLQHRKHLEATKHCKTQIKIGVVLTHTHIHSRHVVSPLAAWLTDERERERASQPASQPASQSANHLDLWVGWLPGRVASLLLSIFQKGGEREGQPANQPPSLVALVSLLSGCVASLPLSRERGGG